MSYEEEINSMLRDETLGLRVVVREIGQRADEEIAKLKEELAVYRKAAADFSAWFDQPIANEW